MPKSSSAILKLGFLSAALPLDPRQVASHPVCEL